MTGPQADELWDDRYRLVRRLGTGGMASVWLARDERLGRDVAVKVLSDVLAGDREYIERFEREAQVAARLNHPNLVAIYDFAVAGERPYLVMELISGGAIATDTLSSTELERLAEELLAALEHIHEASVVHRDLKPANVLVDERGRFRLTDFGIAQPSDATSLTQTGNLIGTMKYMAPEVRAGQRATVRSDLYSLGVLLRECGAAASPVLAPLLEALAHADPAARPASAREAAALLRVATVPTRLSGPTAPTRVLTTRGARRSPLVAAAAAASVAALAVALTIAAGDGGDDGAPTPVPTPDEAESPQGGARDEPDAQNQPTEEDKKAAEKPAGDDKDAKKAIKPKGRGKAIGKQKKDRAP